MEVPTWWVVSSGVFFVLGSIFLLALIVAVIFMIRTLQTVQAKVNMLSQRVETVSHRVEELVTSAKEVTGQAKGITSTLGGIASSSAHKIELLTTAIFVLGAIGKMRRSFGKKKSK